MFDGTTFRETVVKLADGRLTRRYPELNAYQQSYLLFIQEQPDCLTADICREYMHGRDPKKVYDTVCSLVRRGLVRQTRVGRNCKQLRLTSAGERAVFDLENPE